MKVWDETWGKKPGGRRCGECQLCCKLLPTRDLNKPANTKCRYQKHGKGCTIYERRPESCATFVCRWLAGADLDTMDLPRPDRSHYVLDPVPDYITVVDTETGERMPGAVIQVWLDPNFPDAHRDPALRHYIERQEMPALIRLSDIDGWVLWPPSCCPDHQWHEVHSTMREKPHTVAETMAALGSTVTVQTVEGRMAKSDDADMALELIAVIGPLLHGAGRSIQGAVLADLVATWLAGHQGPASELDDFREQLLADWLITVRRLTKVNHEQILASMKTSGKA